MKKLFSVVLVSMLALGSFAARAADEERSELRQRAEEYQAQRARNPEFQPGEGRLAPEHRAEKAPKREQAHAKRTSKTSVKSAPKETRRERVGKRVRSLKKLPGAFVRR